LIHCQDLLNIHSSLADHAAYLVDSWPDFDRPIHSDARKKIGRVNLGAYPSVNFDFLDSIQLPDLMLDLFCGHW
jgi:hypothetical protein